MNKDSILDYLRSLKVGERVIETGNSCMTGKCGVVYMSDDPEHGLCVLWDGPEKFGTGVTHGTRRLRETIAKVVGYDEMEAARDKLALQVKHMKSTERLCGDCRDKCGNGCPRCAQQTAEKQRDRLEDALKELVECKRLLGVFERRDDDNEAARAYRELQTREPLAWAIAQAIVGQAQADKGAKS